MRPSLFFRYPSGKYARDRSAATVLRPALLFAGKFFLLLLAVVLALFFVTRATRRPLPVDANPATPATVVNAASLLADIRSRWPWRLVAPEWVIDPEPGDPLVATETTWLRIEGRARLFVIVTAYLLSVGLLYRRHRRAEQVMASTARAGREGHAADQIAP